MTFIIFYLLIGAIIGGRIAWEENRGDTNPDWLKLGLVFAIPLLAWPPVLALQYFRG